MWLMIQTRCVAWLMTDMYLTKTSTSSWQVPCWWYLLCCRITATLSCMMTLQKLPFDRQICPILFESCKYIIFLSILSIFIIIFFVSLMSLWCVTNIQTLSVLIHILYSSYRATWPRVPSGVVTNGLNGLRRRLLPLALNKSPSKDST